MVAERSDSARDDPVTPAPRPPYVVGMAQRPTMYDTETPQIVAGYWLAAILPPLGFGVGMVTYFRDVRHGLSIMGVAVLGLIVWLSLLLLFFLDPIGR